MGLRHGVYMFAYHIESIVASLHVRWLIRAMNTPGKCKHLTLSSHVVLPLVEGKAVLPGSPTQRTREIQCETSYTHHLSRKLAPYADLWELLCGGPCEKVSTGLRQKQQYQKRSVLRGMLCLSQTRLHCASCPQLAPWSVTRAPFTAGSRVITPRTQVTKFRARSWSHGPTSASYTANKVRRQRTGPNVMWRFGSQVPYGSTSSATKHRLQAAESSAFCRKDQDRPPRRRQCQK